MMRETTMSWILGLSRGGKPVIHLLGSRATSIVKERVTKGLGETNRFQAYGGTCFPREFCRWIGTR